jgi:hypothetical protein
VKPVHARSSRPTKTTTTDTDPIKPATSYHPKLNSTPTAVHDLDTRKPHRTRILGGLINDYRQAT